MQTMDKLYTVEEAAEMLRVSVKTVRRRVLDGTLQHRRPAGTRRVLFAHSDLFPAGAHRSDSRAIQSYGAKQTFSGPTAMTVEVAVDGAARGGDGGHGCAARLTLSDAFGTCWSVQVSSGKDSISIESPVAVTIEVAGSSELEMLSKAISFAAKHLTAAREV